MTRSPESPAFPGGVLITGMHRSGTSMTASMLRDQGVYIGRDDELLGAQPDNPQGFFEYEALVRLGDDLLQDLGGAWDLPPEPAVGFDDPRIDDERRERAVDLVARLSNDAPRWGFKDPRSAFLVRFWSDLVPDLRWVVCVRDPLEVALSLRRRNGSSSALAIDLWMQTYRTLLADLAPDDRIVVHYDRQLSDPEGEVRRLCAFIGLEPVETRPRPDPGLRNHRTGSDGVAAGFGDELLDLYRQLCREADHPQAARRRPSVGVDNARLDTERLQRRLDRTEQHAASLREQVAASARAVEHHRADADAGPLRRRIDALERTVFDMLARADPQGSGWYELREALEREVPATDRIAVAAKGHPIVEVLGRSASAFPQDEAGRYPGFALGSSVSSVAHVESLRYDGIGWLAFPAWSTWWFEMHRHFADYLADHFDVRDVDGGHRLVDMRTRRIRHDQDSAGTGSLRSVVGTSGPERPAVLDWTVDGLGAQLVDLVVFRPVDERDDLAYFDATIDVVVTDRRERTSEAARVAAQIVVLVERSSPVDPVRVVEVLRRPGAAASEQQLPWHLAVTGDDALGWTEHLVSALDIDPDRVVQLGSGEAIDPESCVAVVDSGVLPLDNSIESALETLSLDASVGAVAGKLFRPDGSVESAGEIVFSNGSTGSIAAGSFTDDAAWHEYVRPMAWGAGLMVFRSERLDAIEPADVGHLPHLASAYWRHGGSTIYVPAVASVRLRPAVDVKLSRLPPSEIARGGSVDTVDWHRVVIDAESRGTGPAVTT